MGSILGSKILDLRKSQMVKYLYPDHGGYCHRKTKKRLLVVPKRSENKERKEENNILLLCVG